MFEVMERAHVVNGVLAFLFATLVKTRGFLRVTSISSCHMVKGFPPVPWRFKGFFNSVLRVANAPSMMAMIWLSSGYL